MKYYFMLHLWFFNSSFSLKNANITNIQPVLGVGVKNIIKGVKETAISYSGFEILLIFYPFINRNVKIKNQLLRV